MTVAATYRPSAHWIRGTAELAGLDCTLTVTVETVDLNAHIAQGVLVTVEATGCTATWALQVTEVRVAAPPGLSARPTDLVWHGVPKDLTGRLSLATRIPLAT